MTIPYWISQPILQLGPNVSLEGNSSKEGMVSEVGVMAGSASDI